MKFTVAISLLTFVLPFGSFCANAASFPPLSYVEEDTIDTGVIVFLTDDEVAEIQENFNNGEATQIATDVSLYKSKNDSNDLSNIKYIELSNPNTIKEWNGQGYEDDLDIEFGNTYDLGPTELTCSDNTGQCSPFVDGTNNIALIEVRFRPRSGWAHSGQYWRNKYTLTGTYYCIVTPSSSTPSSSPQSATPPPSSSMSSSPQSATPPLSSSMSSSPQSATPPLSSSMSSSPQSAAQPVCEEEYNGYYSYGDRGDRNNVGSFEECCVLTKEMMLEDGDINRFSYDEGSNRCYFKVGGTQDNRGGQWWSSTEDISTCSC